MWFLQQALMSPAELCGLTHLSYTALGCHQCRETWFQPMILAYFVAHTTYIFVSCWYGRVEKKGGQLASTVHSYTQHGDPAICRLVQHTLAVVSFIASCNTVIPSLSHWMTFRRIELTTIPLCSSSTAFCLRTSTSVDCTFPGPFFHIVQPLFAWFSLIPVTFPPVLLMLVLQHFLSVCYYMTTGDSQPLMLWHCFGKCTQPVDNQLWRTRCNPCWPRGK